MRLRFLPALNLTVLTVLLIASTPISYAETRGKLQRADSPSALIEAVNALRTSYGLAPYSINATLMETAQSHADYMAATGSVSHTGAGGSSVTGRLLAAGYPLAGDLSSGGFRSENITSGSEGKTAEDAVNQWTGDELHLTTMISPNLTEIGAGVAVSAGRVYYVIDCAQPTNGGISPIVGTSITGNASDPSVKDTMIPEVVVTPTSQPPQTATAFLPTATTKTIQSSTTSTRSIRGYIIGIVVIALLGSGLFMWLGKTSNE